MKSTQPSQTYIAFAATIIIGGANFIAVSFSNQELPPFFGAALRFGLATLLFFLLTRLMGVPLARGRSAVGAAVYGLLSFGVAYALIYYALVGLTAGTTAVIMATVPLFTLMIAVLFRQERLSTHGVIGSILVIAGIAILSLGTLGGDLNYVYLIAAILGAVAAAASSVVARGLRHVHPVNMNGIGMAAGTLLLVFCSLLAGEPWALPRQTQTWLAVSWLVLLGSVGLFQLFLYLIKRLTASATVYALAGMPLIAVVLGAVMLNQPITVEVVVGGGLVITAVYIGALSGMKGGPQPKTPARAAGSAESGDN
ncbi:MAG TPA: EamA family transporter [Chloroflexota bacterium]|nr:EamA family transporter [Chloroflexota bacterium]